MRIFGRPLQTAMSYLCALCQPLPLSFVVLQVSRASFRTKHWRRLLWSSVE